MTLSTQHIVKQGFQPNLIAESISRSGFWGKTDTERSGYWRLFFMQMQEEALKPKPEVKVVESTPEVKTVIAKPVKKKAAKKTAPPVAKKSKPPEPKNELLLDTNRHPIFTSWAILSVEVQKELLQIYPFFTEIRLKIVEEAANDTDMRRRLLLLAA